MSKFKVGDRVRLINPGLSLMKFVGKLGKIVEATDPNYNRIYYYVKFDEQDAGSYITYTCEDYMLELVEEELVRAETELEELVRKANEGLEAFRELYKSHKKSIEFKNPTACLPKWRPLTEKHTVFGREFRIKPKPLAFEPYTIESTGWRVEYIAGENAIQIGCKLFPVCELKAALEALLHHHHSDVQLGGNTLYAKRPGLDYHKGNLTLPWKDAEELFDKIKDL